MDINTRLKEAGMMTIPEMKQSLIDHPFLANADVTDLRSFRNWLHMRHKEMAEMQAKMILDKKEDDDLYEWVLSHCAVLSEVIANFEKAITIINK